MKRKNILKITGALISIGSAAILVGPYALEGFGYTSFDQSLMSQAWVKFVAAFGVFAGSAIGLVEVWKAGVHKKDGES